jgi:hypothetical protein
MPVPPPPPKPVEKPDEIKEVAKEGKTYDIIVIR